MAIDFKPLDQDEGRNHPYSPPSIDFQELPSGQEQPKMVDTFLGKMPKDARIFKDKEDMHRQMQKAMEMYGLMLGGSAIKAPQFIANAVSKLPGMVQGGVNLLGRTGAGTALTTGANALSPENKRPLGELTKENALWNLGAELLPPGLKMAGKGIGRVLSPLQPQKYAEQILNTIGGGKSIEDNAKMFAQKIKDAYKTAKTSGKKLYDDIFSAHNMGAVSDVLPQRKLLNQYSNIDKKIIDKYSPKLEELHLDLLENPSIQKSHELQSQLGSEIRRLKKMDERGNLSTYDNNVLQSLQKSQHSLIRDIKNGLGKKLGQDYENATEYWAQNVVPYTENPKIATIAKKKLEKIKGKELQNISESFKNPNEDMLKVVNELGPDAWKHILYDKLGKLRTNLTPERLSKEIENLKNQGFGSYVHPDLEGQIAKLAGKSRNKELLQRSAGALAGYKLGSSLGVPGEFAGGALGGLLSPNVWNIAKIIKPGNATANAIADFMSKAYRPLARTGIAKKDDITNYIANE